MDNKLIKDGFGNSFTLRMRDVSNAQDGSLQYSMFLGTPYPLDYGPGGIYQHCARSSTFLTGISGEHPIYSFRWPAAQMMAAIQRVRIMAWCTTTPFAAGVGMFAVYIARNFTLPDTGGTSAVFGDGSAKLRGTMNSAEASIIFSNNSPLTPGTRVTEATPIDSRDVLLPTAAYGLFSNQPLTLFEKLAGEHPLVLQNNEGFIVQASVPGSGSWQFAITTEWAEIQVY